MNSNDMVMRDEWFMMPFGGLFAILVFMFLILGIAAFGEKILEDFFLYQFAKPAG